MDWVQLVQNRDQWMPLMNTITDLLSSRKLGNFLTSWATINFSRKTLLCRFH
jgi:hypothetical protein